VLSAEIPVYQDSVEFGLPGFTHGWNSSSDFSPLYVTK
jgi:hypothetical protein